jgi:hypothetical protein
LGTVGEGSFGSAPPAPDGRPALPSVEAACSRASPRHSCTGMPLMEAHWDTLRREVTSVVLVETSSCGIGTAMAS